MRKIRLDDVNIFARVFARYFKSKRRIVKLIQMIKLFLMSLQLSSLELSKLTFKPLIDEF